MTLEEGMDPDEFLGLADTIMETLHLWQAMPKEKRDDIFAKARHELCWEQERHLLTDAVAAVLPMD